MGIKIITFNGIIYNYIKIIGLVIPNNLESPWNFCIKFIIRILIMLNIQNLFINY